MKYAARLLLSCGLLSLAACGFQLRGSSESGQLKHIAQPLYLAIDDPQIYRLFSQQLRNHQLQLSDRIDQAHSVLQIQPLTSQNRRLTVGEHGSSAQLQLIESLRWQLQDGDGNIVQDGEAQEFRVLHNNPNDVVSVRSEEAQLRRDMRSALSRRIIQQLSAGAQSRNEHQP